MKHLCTGGDSNGPVLQSHQHAHVEVKGGYYEKVYAKSGSGHFNVESDGLYQKDFYYYIEYGHATLSYDIGFSVSVPGGGAGSISFSVVTAYAGSDSGSHRW